MWSRAEGIKQEKRDQDYFDALIYVPYRGARPDEDPEEDRERRIPDENEPHGVAVARNLWDRHEQRRQEREVSEAVEDEHGIGEVELEVDQGSREREHGDADPEHAVLGGTRSSHLGWTYFPLALGGTCNSEEICFVKLRSAGKERCFGSRAADAANKARAASRAPIQYGAGMPRWSKARLAMSGPTMRVTLITACEPPMTLPCSLPETRREMRAVSAGMARPALTASAPTTG